MQPYIRRSSDGARTFGHDIWRHTLALDWVPIDLVDACTDFCDADPADYDAGKVADALAAADSLEAAAFPPGTKYSSADTEAVAVRGTVDAVRERAETWKSNRAKEQAAREYAAEVAAQHYLDALHKLAEATAYLDAHDAPDLPPSWQRPSHADSSPDEAANLARLTADVERWKGAAKGLSAKGRREAVAYLDALLSLLDSKRAGSN